MITEYGTKHIATDYRDNDKRYFGVPSVMGGVLSFFAPRIVGDVFYHCDWFYDFTILQEEAETIEGKSDKQIRNGFVFYLSFDPMFGTYMIRKQCRPSFTWDAFGSPGRQMWKITVDTTIRFDLLESKEEYLA